MKFSVTDRKTGKAPDLQKITLDEFWAQGLVYCSVDGFATMEDGTLILTDATGTFAHCPQGRFRVDWEIREN